MRALSPSALQSEMGQPWSRVENGQAPREMWRYHFTSGPGQSSRTCPPPRHVASARCMQAMCHLYGPHARYNGSDLGGPNQTAQPQTVEFAVSQEVPCQQLLWLHICLVAGGQPPASQRREECAHSAAVCFHIAALPGSGRKRRTCVAAWGEPASPRCTRAPSVNTPQTRARARSRQPPAPQTWCPRAVSRCSPASSCRPRPATGSRAGAAGACGQRKVVT